MNKIIDIIGYGGHSKVILELAKFNNIKFHDKEHIYYLDKVRTKSVTSIIGEYKHPFDKDYWSQKKADERGISKEEILTAAFHSNKLIYGVALFTAALTSFYMFRLYFSIFWSKESTLQHHHGEGTWSMKLPLLILAACAVLVGFVPFSNFITSDGKALETHIDLIFSIDFF